MAAMTMAGIVLRVGLAILAACVAAILLVFAQPTASAIAATITVTAVTEDTSFGQNQELGCSIREAIVNANTNSQAGSAECAAGDPAPTVDTIVFNIPGEIISDICCVVSVGCTTCVIPAIESDGGPVFVDGYTQPGSQMNTSPIGQPVNAQIRIGITGAPLVIQAAGSSVRGIAFRGSSANTINDVYYFAGGVVVDASDVTVTGNYLGFTPGGIRSSTRPAPPLTVRAPSAKIGGPTPAERNVIACGMGGGDIFLDPRATAATIQGNHIGAGVNGASANCVDTDTTNGILLGGANNVVIGGAGPGEGNLIAFNALAGVRILAGGGTVIRGNTITQNAGGVDVVQGSTTAIGGTGAGEGNTISANTDYGVSFEASTDATIFGNSITQNTKYGVLINGGTGNRVGGVGSGEGNLISANLVTGVAMTDGSTTPIRGNRISGNLSLPVDLFPSGPTPNDPGDVDGGPNALQNYPVLTSIRLDSGTVRVFGSLNSEPNRTYTIDVYGGPTCGEQYVGLTSVSTDDNGNGTFSLTAPVGADATAFVATATDPVGRTSEYAVCARESAPAVNVVPRALTVVEGGTPGGFALGLNQVPLSPVTVQVQADASQVTVSPATVTFQPNATALQAQTVTVTPVNDTVRNPTRTVPIHVTSSSADAPFNGLTIPDESVTITDDDLAACTPRPKVGIQTTKQPGGVLRVTITSTSQAGATNTLKSFTWTSLANATVTVDGIGPASQGQVMAIPAGAQGVTFQVRQVTAGQPTTVRFTVADACGDWSTFVGGGPGAW
jgi:hypothetical protein